MFKLAWQLLTGWKVERQEDNISKCDHNRWSNPIQEDDEEQEAKKKQKRRRRGGLRGKVGHQPVVLVTADSKVGVVGEVDHVSWSHIDRVPQRAVWATGIGQHRYRVARNVWLELGVVGKAHAVGGVELGL